MNHLDFLNTAKKLITTENPTEADIRSAVSRSYYAVYHHVLLWWKTTDFPDYKDRGHAKIQMALFNAGIHAARNFSRSLKELNTSRRYADYKLAIKFKLKRGLRILTRACRAIADFDAIDKNALSDGIEDYLRKTKQI